METFKPQVGGPLVLIDLTIAVLYSSDTVISKYEQLCLESEQGIRCDNF